jgi:outer membrane protein assembly factor BamB
MWQKSYTSNEGATYTLAAASVQDGIFAIWASETKQWHGYDINSGNALWVTEPQGAWDMTVSTVGNIAYGKLFSCGYAGILYAYDVKTGKTAWTYAAKDPTYLESKWGGNYILEHLIIADGKIYVFSGEHSPDNPPERGAPLLCIDVNTGQLLWQIPFYLSHWARNPALADGIIVYLNVYDNQMYAIGKGESATTVSAPQTVVPAGTGVMITGTVTDQSAGAKATPAIGDAYMDAWMEYLYMQYPIPSNAQGVPVKLTAVDSNGASIDIGTVTSDMSGTFKKMWTPPAEGEYTIIATFEGSGAYAGSYGETAIGVSAAQAATSGTEEAPAYSATDIVIIVAVVVAILIGIVNLLALRKRP